MTHHESRALNRAVIQRVTHLVDDSPSPWRIPGYKAVVAILSAEGYVTGWGEPWTPHRLYRMLQRNGYSGLYGIKNQCSPAHYRAKQDKAI